jgi:hypothetical protein
MIRKQRHRQAAFHMNVDAPARRLWLAFCRPTPARDGLGFQNSPRQRWMHGRAKQLGTELARHQENGIPQFLRGEPAHWKAPEQEVLRIFFKRVLRSNRAHLVSLRSHQEPVHRLKTPAVLDEGSRQMVQQFGVRRKLAQMPKVVRRRHQATAKMVLPDPVDCDAAHERVFRLYQPVGKRQAPAGR